MKIVVGLGNPDEKYSKTRHNTGWMFLDYLSEKYDFEIQKKTLNSLIAEVNINNEKVVFVKPLTYMNLSGNAVQKVKNWYKVENKDILVVFDDIDIPFGDVRYKLNGSGGTHNGMKNIVQMLNAKDFPRIKIGIGGMKHEKQDLVDFVLQKYTKRELNELESKIFVDAEEKLYMFLKS
ncbi:MAG: aminoacyl-tRNA hydrolase [Clostridia bacterium]|nr:aminoacyl-tRNA hydrolase [Clostridia bacterium]